MHVHRYVYTSMYTHAYVCIHVKEHIHAQTFMPSHMYQYILVPMCAHTCKHIYTHSCTCLHTHVYHIHPYIYAHNKYRHIQWHASTHTHISTYTWTCMHIHEYSHTCILTCMNHEIQVPCSPWLGTDPTVSSITSGNIECQQWRSTETSHSLIYRGIALAAMRALPGMRLHGLGALLKSWGKC